MANEPVFPLMALSRLRMGTDGAGVSTLAAACGCPLRCRMCLNPHSWNGTVTPEQITPGQLYERVRIDDLYFRATGGGVTFGGGESLLYADFIRDFVFGYAEGWHICAETSLNVPEDNIRRAAEAVDRFIVDVKDMNPSIYGAYTGCDNVQVIRNLQTLQEIAGTDRVLLRIPLIPGYNTADDVQRSKDRLRAMGFEHFDCFKYRVC